MITLRTVLARLRGVFGKPRSDDELNVELQAHLDLLIAANIRRGMSPEEARYAASREFGGLEQTKEAYRDQSGFHHFRRIHPGSGARCLHRHF